MLYLLIIHSRLKVDYIRNSAAVKKNFSLSN